MQCHVMAAVAMAAWVGNRPPLIIARVASQTEAGSTSDLRAFGRTDGHVTRPQSLRERKGMIMWICTQISARHFRARHANPAERAQLLSQFPFVLCIFDPTMAG